MNFGKYLSAIMMLLVVSGNTLADVADFALRDLQGKMHTIADHQGKWIVVNYWATWCPPCLEEMPELEIFHNNHYPDTAVVLGVNMEDVSREKIEAFVEEQFLSFPILPASADVAQPLGRVPGLPTTFLISPEGEVVARQVGGLTAQTLEAFISNYEEHVEQ